MILIQESMIAVKNSMKNNFVQKLPKMGVAYCLASIWQFALSTGQAGQINIKINESQVIIIRVIRIAWMKV